MENIFFLKNGTEIRAGIVDVTILISKHDPP